MQAKKKSIVFLPIAFCFLFIFLATPCAGLDDKKAGNKVNMYKIEPVQSSQTQPGPEAGPASDAKTDPAALHPSREIVFVLDNSGSMKINDPERITKNVVISFIKKVPVGTRLGMVIFGRDARALEPLTEITGTKVDAKFINSLNRLDYQSQLTNTPSGIERAIYELKTNGKTNAEKVIILLTDGIIDTGDPKQDAESEMWLKENLALECEQLGIRIFGIAFTDKADFRLMQILSSKTGGEYFRIYQAEEIQGVFDNIDEQLSNPTAAAIAIIIVVFILLLLIYKNSHKKSAAAALGESDTRLHPGIRPDAQAELIDVAHVIPQGSISLAIDKESVSIGRDPHNDIVIPEKVVSNLHATITYKGGQYYLEDNRSTNGTRLNNVRIQQNTKVKLKSGDVIHFAKCEFRFLVYDQAPYGETMLIDMD